MFLGIAYHIHYTSLRLLFELPYTHILYYMGHMHAGMENQYMDQYQNTAKLCILNQDCMILTIEESKRGNV